MEGYLSAQEELEHARSFLEVFKCNADCSICENKCDVWLRGYDSHIQCDIELIDYMQTDKLMSENHYLKLELEEAYKILESREIFSDDIKRYIIRKIKFGFNTIRNKTSKLIIDIRGKLIRKLLKIQRSGVNKYNELTQLKSDTM